MDGRIDWSAWHDGYAEPGSALSRRLGVVQRHVAGHLDATAPRPVTALSVCAGDGRDLLQVLETRTDRDRVAGTLIEADERNARRAREHVERLGLSGVEVRREDAGTGAAYRGAVPADLVLLCGIFGNVPDDDVRATVLAAPALCRPEALVIWTRHREPPDLTPAVRGWFGEAGFEMVDFVAPADVMFSVGVERFHGDPPPLAVDRRLFTFFR